MAGKENEMIHRVLDEIKNMISLDPICLIFDGAIVEAPDENSKMSIVQNLKQIGEKLKIALAVNQW